MSFKQTLFLITSASALIVISAARAEYADYIDIANVAHPAQVANFDNPADYPPIIYNRFVGPYASFNAGVTYVNKIFDYGGTRGGFLGGGGNLFLGDQVNPYFGPEFGMGYFSFGSNGGVSMFSLNGRFTIPIGDSFSFFFKLGAAYTEVITRISTRVQKNTFLPALGLGFGYGITPQTMVTVEANGVYLPQALGNANGIVGGLTLGITHYWSS